MFPCVRGAGAGFGGEVTCAFAWGTGVLDVSTRLCRLLSTFSVLGPVCADNEPLGYPLGALGSFPAKYCSRARLNG